MLHNGALVRSLEVVFAGAGKCLKTLYTYTSTCMMNQWHNMETYTANRIGENIHYIEYESIYST